jgi:hypothetical protein
MRLEFVSTDKLLLEEGKTNRIVIQSMIPVEEKEEKPKSPKTHPHDKISRCKCQILDQFESAYDTYETIPVVLANFFNKYINDNWDIPAELIPESYQRNSLYIPTLSKNGHPVYCMYFDFEVEDNVYLTFFVKVYFPSLDDAPAVSDILTDLERKYNAGNSEE